MNKHYKLLKSRDNEYAYMSMSTDFARPDEYKEQLEIELRQVGHEGRVIFDLLLCNGIKRERFYSAYFDGDKIINSTFIRVQDIRAELVELCAEFYSQHYDLVLKNQILTKPQKFLIKKGITKNYNTW